MDKNMKKRKKNKLLIIIILIIIILLLLFILTKSFSNSSNKESNNIISNIEYKNTITNINITENISIENILVNNEVNNNITNNNINNTTNNEIIEKPIDENNGSNNRKNREFGNNVAFIGDSRTQAFLMYAGLNNVRDYTNIGLMVDTAITKKFITNSNGEKITILEDLKNRNIDTIYIMLGINELGWVYSSMFIKEYEKLIDNIKEVKPNCEIILQSIIPVTKTKSDNDNIYNNQRITEYNSLIQELANKKNIKFVNLVPSLTDKDGNLPAEASSDGIHLNKKYCLKWLDCLRNN